MNILDKKGLASLKFGDIIENGYASADNPTRIGVFIRFKTVPRGQINAGKAIECRSDNGAFWTTDFGNDRLRKIGSILADRAAQAERMARLEAAMRPFVTAWNNLHPVVTQRLCLGDLGRLAAANISGGDFQRADRALSQEGSEPS